MNKVNATRLVQFRQKENKLTGISNEQNCSHEQKQIGSKFDKKHFPRHEHKVSVSSQKQLQKVCITYFSGKVVKRGRVGLPVCLSIIFYLTLLCGELYRIKFSDMLFVLDQRLQKRISIQIFLSFAKFVDSLIRENVRSKLRITFHRFWQLFLFKWLQSSFSWRKILVKH